MDSGGIVLTDEKINESLGNDDVACSAGVGLATFKKAVIARSILEALQNGRGLAGALVAPKYGVVKLYASPLNCSLVIRVL